MQYWDETTHVVLGTTVALRAAAAVEVFVLACTGTANTTLSVTADIDVRDCGGVRIAGGGA